MAFSTPVLPAVALALTFCLPAYSQARPAAKTPTAPKPKLTPEQQRGLRLLKASQAEAAGLQPEMRAFVLWQVSHGYSKLLPEKSAAALREAMQVAESMPEDNVPEGCKWEVCHMQQYLERHLAEEMMNHAESTGQFDEIEHLLPRLVPEVQQQVVEGLIMHYVRKDQFVRAQNLLNQIADDKEYPYFAANELMLRDPRPEDRLAVFDQAMARFRQQSDASPQSEDVAEMVMRFSHSLPSTTVLDAIDQILARAKEQDEDQKKKVVLHDLSGSVYFDSRYEFRLFQLLPVLEDLDKSKAEGLLRDNAQVGKSLGTYPKGPRSLDPGAFGDKPVKEDQVQTETAVETLDSEDPASAASEQAQDQVQMQVILKMEKLGQEADKDPKQAYDDAQELPVRYPGSKTDTMSPRAEGLRDVAYFSIKKDPAIARSAMNDLRKLVADLDIATQGRMLTVVPYFYIEIGDLDEARNSIRDLLKLAGKLYARDVDSSDPNLLFKGIWPSTALWRRCVEYGAKVSPEFAEEVIASVPDADIGGFERVIYGATLAGAPRFSAAIVEWHKGGRHAGIMF
jgi:hypothetical protein